MAQKFNDVKKNVSKYWNTKPVMKLNDKHFKTTQILSDEHMNKTNIQTHLPDGYTWNTIHLHETEQMNTICKFLYDNYPILTSTDKLRWIMQDTGYFLTITDTQNIIALVGVTFKNLQIGENKYSITEPLYMCCTPDYRNTGIPTVLIDEVSRMSLLSNITKGLFCNNRIVSKPIATIRQYMRPINYIKMRKYNFIDVIERDETIVQTKLNINLKPNKNYVLAECTEDNIDIVHNLYTNYMMTFNVHMILTKEEIKHYLFNENYTKTYLVYNDDKKPVDFITYSFYDIPVHDNEVIKASNILMYSSNNVITELLFINVLKQLSYDGVDIVYINDMMHNNEFILSNVKNADNDTDSDEEKAVYDMNIIKTNKKYFLTLYNLNSPVYTQNMVSWFIF
jgi:hypothetical protein